MQPAVTNCENSRMIFYEARKSDTNLKHPTSMNLREHFKERFTKGGLRRRLHHRFRISSLGTQNEVYAG